jgi:phosphoglycerate dehydrogenase-like enzyme
MCHVSKEVFMCTGLAVPAGGARPDVGEFVAGVAELYPRPASEPFRRVVGSSSRAEIVGDHDLVVAFTALPAGTRGLTGPDVRAIRSGVKLSNLGRRRIVDEYAPAAALEAGRLGGAVLDVVNRQPGDLGSAPLVGTSRKGGIG